MYTLFVGIKSHESLFISLSIAQLLVQKGSMEFRRCEVWYDATRERTAAPPCTATTGDCEGGET